MKKTNFFITLLILLKANFAQAYPLDGFDETNISRLDGYFHSLLTDDGLKNLTAGALLSYTELSLKKPKQTAFPQRQDARLRSRLAEIAGNGISISVLDISNPKEPIYAGIRDDQSFVPGSVGKIMVAISLFDALQRMYPKSIKDRERLLRERFIVANSFIEHDTHDVPFWDAENRKIYFRPLIVGDRANLWTYLDWMLSASSNAAASMVMREVLLMNHFGSNYPPSDEAAERFIRTSGAQYMSSSFLEPMRRAGFGSGRLFQASFFTKGAKSVIGNGGSSATTKDLVQLLWQLEQGKVVDEFSSLEIKRLLYMTQKRERFAGAEALNDAAVYFKAGSLYKCGGPCEKYEGTLTNMMNAVGIIEYPVGKKDVNYLVSVSSNVLRYNSNQLHHELGGKVHRILMDR